MEKKTELRLLTQLLFGSAVVVKRHSPQDRFAGYRIDFNARGMAGVLRVWIPTLQRALIVLARNGIISKLKMEGPDYSLFFTPPRWMQDTDRRMEELIKLDLCREELVMIYREREKKKKGGK